MNLGGKTAGYSSNVWPPVTRLQNEFPYRTFHEETQTFHMPKSVMVLMELPLLTGSSSALENDLESCFERILEEDITVRIWRLTHTCLFEQINAFSNQYRNGQHFFDQLADNQFNYYLKAVRQGLASQNSQMPLMDSRLFCEIIIPAKHSDAEHLKAAQRCQRLSENFIRELKTVDMNAVVRNQVDLLSLLRFILIGESNFKWDSDYDAHESLHDQIYSFGADFSVVHNELDATPCVEVKQDDRIRRITTFSIEKYPHEQHLAYNLSMLARLDRGLSLSTPHLISLTFRAKDRFKAKKWIQNKDRSINRVAGKQVSKLIPRYQEQRAEIAFLKPKIENDEARVTYNIFTVTLLASKDQHEQAVSEAKRLFSWLNLQLQVLRDMQLPLLLSALPGFMGEGYFQDCKRISLVKTMTLHNSVSLMPALGNWKGTFRTETGAPVGFIAPGPHGQLSFIDLYSLAADNRNVALPAGSGSGKSVLIQALLTLILAGGGQAFVIDKGGSYKKTCELLGGKYIEAKTVRLNPFHGLAAVVEKSQGDPDRLNTIAMYMSLVRNLIGVMICPRGTLDDVMRAYLLKAVQIAYEKKGKEANIDAVQDALKERNKLIEQETGRQDLLLIQAVEILDQYTTGNLYGEFFNAYDDITHHDFVVLEMNSLEDNDDVLKIVLYSVMNTISQAMYLGDHARRKLCIIDEAWKLLEGGNYEQALFIEQGYRTSRKHGGSFMAITQGIDDFTEKGPVAKAAWNASDVKIFMRQNPSAFKTFNHNYPNFFTQQEIDSISKFQKAADVGYSSFLLKAGNNSTLHRLYLTPEMRILFTTDPDEVKRINILKAQNISLWDICSQVAKERGYA